MTTARLFERLRALPDDVREREVKRVMLRVMGGRFALGLLAMVAWKAAWRYVALESEMIEWVFDQGGSAFILYLALYPLIRILRMSDEEFDQELKAAR